MWYSFWPTTSWPHASDPSVRSACPMTSSSFRVDCRAPIFENVSRSDFMTSNVCSHYGRQQHHRRRACRAGMHKQCGVGEDARGCPWSSSKKVEAAHCAAPHSEEHSPTCDPAPDHITAPVVDARYGVHVLAPHGEGPRRVSCTERLGPVRYMLRACPDNRSTLTKASGRPDSDPCAKPPAPRGGTL